MKKPLVSMGIITDASPKGWGAILVKVVDGHRKQLVPLEAVEGLISEDEAKLLEVPWGESASQAVMEALAILRAVDNGATSYAYELSSYEPIAQWRWQ